VRSIGAHPSDVTALALHPYASALATGCRDGTLRVFDYATPAAARASVRAVPLGGGAVRALDMHPGGDHALAAAGGGGVRLVDLETGGCYVVRGEGPESSGGGVVFFFVAQRWCFFFFIFFFYEYVSVFTRCCWLLM
jgi:WD40 repeat protein